jgi:hypothetical protein
LAILDKILEGERDPHELAKLRNHRIKATEEVIAKSLMGDYRPEHVFTLRQSLAVYRTYQQFIRECEKEIQAALENIDSKKPDSDDSGGADADPTGNDEPVAPSPAAFQLQHELERILGVDLTQVPSLSLRNIQTLVGEVGPDLTKFRNAGAFASWLGLCPANDVSGGAVLRTGTRKVKNRAAQALRLAAQTLFHSKTPLGDFYRRMRAKLGGPKAVTATAHKLARLIYHLVTTGQPYDETVFAKQQQRYRKHQEASLLRKAKELGFAVIPISLAPQSA